MQRPASKPANRLSYLVGPGPSAPSSPAGLRIGLCNTGEDAQALRLRLSLKPVDSPSEVLARAEIGLVVPRRRGREVAATVDWRSGRLVLGSCSVALQQTAPSGRLLACAELFDGRGDAPEVLEVGLRAPTAAK
jgi:hypothetical protein